MSTPVELMEREENNACASTDLSSKIKILTIFFVESASPTQIVYAAYSTHILAFQKQLWCVRWYVLLHRSVWEFRHIFYKIFPRPILFSAVWTISKFLSAFLSPSNFYTTFYLDSILFSALPDIEKFLQALVSFLKIEGVSQKYIRIEIDTAFRC